MKILAIQFRYLGDAVLLTPALRAIKEQFPKCALHALVPQEVAPLLEHSPDLQQVWPFPRVRGQANLPRAWPLLRRLRQERFERSVDFVGNDRGALVSLLCGARERLAPFRPGGFLARRFCYTQTVRTVPELHQVRNNFGVLSAWGIKAPPCPQIRIWADPALAAKAQELLPKRAILCHIATSQPKKEWPVSHWADFLNLAQAEGHDAVFCAGTAAREQALLEALRQRVPRARILPPVPELATFLAVLQRARLFISGDTGPLHFAAGLGAPTISLFGPSSASQWAPLGTEHRFLQGGKCSCNGQTAVCLSPNPCISLITPQAVWRAVSEALREVVIDKPR